MAHPILNEIYGCLHHRPSNPESVAEPFRSSSAFFWEGSAWLESTTQPGPAPQFPSAPVKNRWCPLRFAIVPRTSELAGDTLLRAIFSARSFHGLDKHALVSSRWLWVQIRIDSFILSAGQGKFRARNCRHGSRTPCLYTHGLRMPYSPRPAFPEFVQRAFAPFLFSRRGSRKSRRSSSLR